MKKAFRRCAPALPKGEAFGMNLSVTFGDTSPGRRGLGRPGKPCCPHRPTWAQGSGPCSHWQRLRDYALPKGAGQAVVNRDSGARSFPIAENFARPVRPPPTRQWLPYQGSWRKAPERLYQSPPPPFPANFSSSSCYNLPKGGGAYLGRDLSRCSSAGQFSHDRAVSAGGGPAVRREHIGRAA